MNPTILLVWIPVAIVFGAVILLTNVYLVVIAALVILLAVLAALAAAIASAASALGRYAGRHRRAHPRPPAHHAHRGPARRCTRQGRG